MSAEAETNTLGKKKNFVLAPWLVDVHLTGAMHLMGVASKKFLEHRKLVAGRHYDI